MRDALITRGVNVRPQKVRYESCPPRGIVTSGAHWTAPARCRARKVLAAEKASELHRVKVGRLRLEMAQAQDLVRALKGAGQDYSDAAALARRARQEYLTITGAMPAGSVTIDIGTDSNKVKAV